MSSTTKPLVLVISGTGDTGLSVLQGLARVTRAWRLATTVRPSSIEKSQVSTLRGLGVEIRPSDWQSVDPAQLDDLFAGVDIVISTVYYGDGLILKQTVLVDAAKRANVKRFIPSDFGTPCPPGVMRLHDEKLQIREYIRNSGIPYTFIDVGLWMQASIPRRSSDKSSFAALLRQFYGDGEKKSAVINLHHIGDYVARIIADPQTLNQYVFVYEDELTLNEIWDIAIRASGEDFRKTSVALTKEDILKQAQSPGHRIWWYDYMISLYIRGDNNVASAKSLGALIGRDLYPDMKNQSVAEYAEQYFVVQPDK